MSQCFEESIQEGAWACYKLNISLFWILNNKVIVELGFHVLEKNKNEYADLGGCFPASHSHQSAWFITSYTAS